MRAEYLLSHLIGSLTASKLIECKYAMVGNARDSTREFHSATRSCILSSYQIENSVEGLLFGLIAIHTHCIYNTPPLFLQRYIGIDFAVVKKV